MAATMLCALAAAAAFSAAAIGPYTYLVCVGKICFFLNFEERCHATLARSIGFVVVYELTDLDKTSTRCCGSDPRIWVLVFFSFHQENRFFFISRKNNHNHEQVW
jgi:hypothetical protein